MLEPRVHTQKRLQKNAIHNFIREGSPWRLPPSRVKPKGKTQPQEKSLSHKTALRNNIRHRWQKRPRQQKTLARESRETEDHLSAKPIFRNLAASDLIWLLNLRQQWNASTRHNIEATMLLRARHGKNLTSYVFANIDYKTLMELTAILQVL